MQSPHSENVSFEFFPPRTPEGRSQASRMCGHSSRRCRPEYFSVTFGAGGSTREGTLNTVMEMHREGLPVAPHISCIGTSRDSVRALLTGYRGHGIHRMVALRGDMPSGAAGGAGDFRYANELVEFIRAETGDWFEIEVAAYPEYHPQSQLASRRSAKLHAQGQCGSRLCDHAVLLQLRCVRYDLSMTSRALGCHGADRGRRHADRQLHAARALLRRVRRRNSALDQTAARKLWRRPRFDSRVRSGCGDAICASSCSRPALPACTSTR